MFRSRFSRGLDVGDIEVIADPARHASVDPAVAISGAASPALRANVADSLRRVRNATASTSERRPKRARRESRRLSRGELSPCSSRARHAVFATHVLRERGARLER
jgi:hypothetical protein